MLKPGVVFTSAPPAPPPPSPHPLGFFHQKIQLYLGNYYLDGPIFFKSGVTISGRFNVEFTTYTDLVFYEGANSGNTAEEAIVVFDHATGAEESTSYLPLFSPF